MKSSFVSAVALSCLLVLGVSSAKADHFSRGPSGPGVSISFGNGYNGFNAGYNRGYQPIYRGGYGGGYPIYRSAQIYTVPVYGGGYGGGYGHHHHHHCR